MSEAYANICYYYRLLSQSTKKLKVPQDVEDLFEDRKQLCSEATSKSETFARKLSILTASLKRYVHEGEANASEIAEKAAGKTLKRSLTFSQKELESTDFLNILLEDKNTPLRQCDNELNHTLPNYFVHTSHHSYFDEKTIVQKMITSAHHNKDDEDHKIIELGIGRALRRGVRVIELILKPNSNGNNVEVHHDWAPHSSESVSKCFDAIRENAFKNSCLPVIIILAERESPINADLRAIVASKIERKFGKSLCSSDKAFNDPLENLKNKFIILSKQPKKEQSSIEKTEDKSSEDYRKLIAGCIEDQDDRLILGQDTGSVRISHSKESSLENAKTSDVISFTQENLLAVYPDPESSYCDPFIGWTRGAQMVNLNKETISDKHLYIMQGLFRAYDNTGYVRKPEILRDKEKKFDPTVWRPIKKIIKVKVYMGTGWHLDFGSEDFDPTSPPDFFVALEIVGVPEDEAMEKTVPEIDEWIPMWNQEFEFPLTVPELAMLVISVGEFDANRSHDFGGQTCLPVWLLRSGIRSVPLYKTNGKQCKAARLLIRFQVD